MPGSMPSDGTALLFVPVASSDHSHATTQTNAKEPAEPKPGWHARLEGGPRLARERLRRGLRALVRRSTPSGEPFPSVGGWKRRRPTATFIVAGCVCPDPRTHAAISGG
jgi:hypothetical protein